MDDQEVMDQDGQAHVGFGSGRRATGAAAGAAAGVAAGVAAEWAVFFPIGETALGYLAASCRSPASHSTDPIGQGTG